MNSSTGDGQARTYGVAKSQAPVPSDCGLSLMPTATFAACPSLDVTCIPGGAGVADAIGEAETVALVRQQAEGARYVTSACTGAFILGVAGLLRGRRPRTHWAFTELLRLVGATHVKIRLVKDGSLITAGGVTSGIDFALSMVAEIAGETAAHTIQLGIEYDPAPEHVKAALEPGARGERWICSASAGCAAATSPCACRRTG